jgi:putative flippase GtrA
VVRFGGIGIVGFMIDAGILQSLFSLGIPPLLGRCVSFPVAVTATWLLNRRHTFRDRHQTRSRAGYPLYLSGQTIGSLLNFAVFGVLIRDWPAAAHRPVLALAFGAGLGLLFNYGWSNFIVFRKSSHES